MLTISIVAVVLTMVLPKSYTAKAVIMPPSNQMGSGLGALLGGSGDAAVSGLLRSFNILGSSTGTDQFFSILDSRRLADIVIKEFDLAKHYKFKKKKKYYPEDVVKRFHQYMKVGETDFGAIEISITDKNPDTALAMANYIVSQLDTINYLLAKEHAGFSRRFFEERLSVIRSDLDSAHSRFARFKIKNNYLDLEKQIKSTVDVLAGVEADRVTMDLKIAQMRNKMGGDNERLAELLRERTVLSKKIEGYMNEGDGSVLLALKSTPTLGIEYAYLFRDVKVQEILYNFVLQMYEQAKMNEANNVPTVTILEHASYPYKKTRPKRMIICLLTFFSGFVVVSSIVLLQKWFAGQKRIETETYRKLAAVAGHLRIRK